MCAFCELGQTGLHDFIRSTEVPPPQPASALASAAGGFPTSAAALRALITQHRDAPYQGTDGKLIFNNAQIIAQLHQTPKGLHWTVPELSYNFPIEPWFPGGESPGFSKLGPTQEGAAHSAINVWDAIIAPDIAFKGATSNALINFANTTTAIQYAHGYYPDDTPTAGSIWFNATKNAANAGREDLITPKIGTWGWTTFIHETGHALGLSHPGKYDASQGQFVYQDAAEYRQDTQMFTVMSYFKAFNTGADIVAGDGQEYIPQTPMMDDIMAIQAWYGAETTRPGNSVYGFNATSPGSVYDFTANKHPFLCIYDTGGVDTIDVSGWNTPSLIDLSPGTFSDADQMTYNISIARGTIIENATTGGGNDLVSGNSVDNVIILNGGDDAAVGFLGKDRIFGGSGKDTIAGEDGDDYLDGGTNIDRMIGGTGDDTFIVSNVADVIVENAGEGTLDWVKAAVTFDLLGGVAVEVLSTTNAKGTAKINLYGNEFSQTITGNAGANTLSDGGKGGADTLIGLGGNDIYKVYNSGTKIVEGPAAGSDTVQAAVNYVVGKGVYIQVIETTNAAGKGAISLYSNDFGQTVNGNAGNNSLRGYGGDDIVNGGDGADKISGGEGKDTLAGNAGADTYYFSSALNASTNVDTIVGFSSIDLISLSSSIFTKAGPAGTLAASAFWSNTTGLAHDASDRIIWETDTGRLYYDSDGTGAAARTLFAVITGNTGPINNADFVIA